MSWTESRFLRRQLDSLENRKESHTSPLQVIGHIDLDGFYAQCEQVRRGLTADDPVACRQWNSLIAVNYAAKKYGVSRHNNADEAKKKCPEIVLAHVATFKKGETSWAYHDNPSPASHKVSLDPFRRESRRIFAVLKEHAPLIEKASIDEAFLELGSIVYKRALKHFPQLKDLEHADSHLPKPPSTDQLGDLHWSGVVIGNTEDPDVFSETPLLSTLNDWDDIFLMIGSMVVAEIRADVLEKLHYTCSAGIANSKILAKLGSGRNKPNNQTIVKASLTKEFLFDSELRDLWGFGGKLGEEVYKYLNIPETGSLPFLYSMSLNEMEKNLADPILAGKLHKIVHGQFRTPISTRITIKSMNSVKQFPRPQKTIDDCKAWLRVFSADIAARLLELEEEYKTTVRPKVLAIHYNLPYQKSKSKQASFTALPKRNFEQLYSDILNASYDLFQVIFSDGVILPAAMLTLTVSGVEFQSNVSTTIESFFNRKPAKKNDNKVADDSNVNYESKSSNKKLEGIIRTESTETSSEVPIDTDDHEDSLFISDIEEISEGQHPKDDSVTLTCPKCSKRITLDDYDEHKDWHFAKDLQQQISTPQSSSYSTENRAPSSKRKTNTSKSSSNTKKSKTGSDSNQSSILNFFKKP